MRLADSERSTVGRDTPSLFMVDTDRTVASDSDGSLPEAVVAQNKHAPNSEIRSSLKDYTVLKEIGRGGMGTVWQAREESAGREVAIKFLDGNRFSSDTARRRFEREVRLSARLEHPYIARIYATGFEDNCYYYAMEYVQGLPLDQHVRRNRYTLEQTLELMQMICEAVGHAHEHGIVHRDLKPSNILITNGGEPRLVDFGLAKRFDGDDSLAQDSISADGHITGSPGYMAPEQASGQSDLADERTDIYALGAILFKLLTGEHPHDQSGPLIDVVNRIGSEPTRLPRDLSPRIHRDLEAIVLKALAKRAEDRYPDTDTLSRDLAAYLAGHALHAGSPRLTRWRRLAQKHWIKIAIVLALIALHTAIGVVIGYLIKDESPNSADPHLFEARIDAIHESPEQSGAQPPTQPTTQSTREATGTKSPGPVRE